MKALTLFSTLAVLAAPQVSAAQLPAAYPDAKPIRSWESLKDVSIPNTTIDSVALEKDGICRVTATVTHSPANDRVKVWIALPTKNWNGRFRGTGGGAYTGGGESSVLGPAIQGYVAGATNTGHEGGSAAFALDEQGRLNWQAIVDYAYLGIHEMTVVGKALTKAFYGKPPRYSYFASNSTGGRQGIVEAERYPEDYDGIASGCPAINWDHFIPGLLWPQVVMNEAGNRLSKEKFAAATVAAVAKCDELDGLKDGIIGEPWCCHYDPQLLVGTKVGNDTFTTSDADVVRRIWEGPRKKDGTQLWFPVARGAMIGSGPHGAGLGWFQYFLVQDPQWDYKTLTRDGFELRFQQSLEQYGTIFGHLDPDLTPFRNRGGKLLIVHGMADPTIPFYGTVNYYQRLQAKMGGEEELGKFVRLFLAPGVEHNLQGPGPAPIDTFEAVVDWVEKGKAPEVIMAERREPPGKGGKAVGLRPLYPYPNVARYQGIGSPDDPKNYRAARSPIPSPRQ